jgi:hypothetical protein
MENMRPYVMKMTGRDLKITLILESESDVLQQMLPDIPTAVKSVTYLKLMKIFNLIIFVLIFIYSYMCFIFLFAVDKT